MTYGGIGVTLEYGQHWGVETLKCSQHWGTVTILQLNIGVWVILGGGNSEVQTTLGHAKFFCFLKIEVFVTLVTGDLFALKFGWGGGNTGMWVTLRHAKH